MKVAIVQDGPVYLNQTETFNKTIRFIQEASQAGADLVVFGECWFSGYPVWLDVCSDVNLWDHEPVKEVWANTFKSGLQVSSDLMRQLQKAIAQNDIYVVMGANEPIETGKGNGTIYNTIYTFDRKGKILNHHRKLMPTFTEKLVHGLGDGHGLKAIETEFGRIGSLICWEHWMPLTRQAMHDESEDIHIALWPHVKELHHVASRHYAHEGRCYVVAVGQIMHKDELPQSLTLSKQVALDEDGLVMRGGSAVYGPDGSIIVHPIINKKELILVDIELERVYGERMNLSVSGHYNRDDIFSYHINKERNY